MATQSKLALPGNFNVRSLVAQLIQLYVANRSRISRAVWITLFVALVHRIRNAIAEQKAASARESRRTTTTSTLEATTAGSGGAAPKKRVALDRAFFRSLMRLIRIVVPGWRSKEARLLISHSFFLILRTIISLKVAEMDGAIVKALVRGNGKEFLSRIVWWMVIAVPATFTNSMVGITKIRRGHAQLFESLTVSSLQLSYHQAELSLSYRTRLTQYIHDKYLSNLTFYGISALDDRIKNPDQLIAVDVSKFSNSLAELYSNLAKPILDMVCMPYLSSTSRKHPI